MPAVWVQVLLQGTWAEGVAGQLLEALALADGSAVQGRRVGAASRALLEAATAAAVAHGPLGPRGPASIHCKQQQQLRSL